MLLNQSLKISLVALVLFNSSFATTNDSSIGDDNGTISFKSQPNISMDKESLFISKEKITVDYVFTNTSQQDLVVPTAFPMPAMYFGSSDHGEIKDFKLWVNGKPIKTERKLVILLDGKTDISKKVTESGWSKQELIDYIWDGFVEDTPPKGKKPLPKVWFDKNGAPLFTLNEYFIWQQNFPAGKPVAIKHSYSPSISKSAQLDMKKYFLHFKTNWPASLILLGLQAEYSNNEHARTCEYFNEFKRPTYPQMHSQVSIPT